MNIEERFQEHQEKALARLVALRAAVERLAAERLARPGDWGVVGTVQHVSELLGEALDFLGRGTCDHCGKGVDTVFDDGEGGKICQDCDDNRR